MVAAFLASFVLLGLLAAALGALGIVEVGVLLAICIAVSVIAGRMVYRRDRAGSTAATRSDAPS